MITRIELDGFKTFQDFSLDLAPLQVIVGANGAGKSNLFDALRLLGRLADSDLTSAHQGLHDQVGELFTIRPGGRRATQMRLAVDLLVARRVQDSWGTSRELTYPRMRYELVIERRNHSQRSDGISLIREALTPMPRHKDRWTRAYNLNTGGAWVPAMTGGRSPLISTDVESARPAITLHQDGRGGLRKVAAERAQRTVLSGIQSTEFPHAFAVAEAMRSWRFLTLNPEALRKPSQGSASDGMGPDGGNLPNALARIFAADPGRVSAISRDLAGRVPGALKVEVEEDRGRGLNTVWIEMEDGRRFPSRSLSEGTLRLLALCTLRHDPAHEGLLCIEEPERSVHPSSLKGLTNLLQNLATDFSQPEDAGLPLRQVICNTQSPVFIGQSEMLANLLFAHLAARAGPDDSAGTQLATRIVQVVPDPVQPPLPIPEDERSFTLSEVRDYLESADLGEAKLQLKSHWAQADGQSSTEPDSEDSAQSLADQVAGAEQFDS